MPSFDKEIEFDIECDECGHALGCSITYVGDTPVIHITPCVKCMDAAYEEGRKEAQE